MERSIILKPLRIFYATEEFLYYIEEWCALSSFPARMEAAPSGFYHGDAFSVAVYMGAKRLILDEIEDLDRLIKESEAAVRRLALGGKPAA